MGRGGVHLEEEESGFLQRLSTFFCFCTKILQSKFKGKIKEVVGLTKEKRYNFIIDDWEREEL